VFDLLLETADEGHEVWRGPLAPHALERLIADTHLAGILVGALPNDGAPVRLDELVLETSHTDPRLRVEVGAGAASFSKFFTPTRALHDDAEVVLTRLLASQTVPAGTYRFRCTPATPPAAPAGGLRIAPLPRAIPPLPHRSLWACGIAALPGCRHPTILLPRPLAAVLVAQARAAADVEVGALLVVEPFITTETPPSRLGLLVVEVVPLGHGTTGTETKLRVTPEALAAVAVDDSRGRCRALAHSHPFGAKAEPHFLSTDDKSVATAFFWRPFSIQVVIDPRFTAPEDALAVFCWVEGALVRVCLTLIDDTTN
jgi:hypothetical protein